MQAKKEVLDALNQIKDEQGKSIQESGMLHSIEIKDGGIVNIKLNLTANYRKAKQLV